MRRLSVGVDIIEWVESIGRIDREERVRRIGVGNMIGRERLARSSRIRWFWRLRGRKAANEDLGIRPTARWRRPRWGGSRQRSAIPAERSVSKNVFISILSIHRWRFSNDITARLADIAGDRTCEGTYITKAAGSCESSISSHSGCLAGRSRHVDIRGHAKRNAEWRVV